MDESFDTDHLQSDGASKTDQEVCFEGETFVPGRNGHWKTNTAGVYRMGSAGKLLRFGKTIYHRLYWDSFAAKTLDNIWLDTQSGGFNDPKVYVVQTTHQSHPAMPVDDHRSRRSSA